MIDTPLQQNEGRTSRWQRIFRSERALEPLRLRVWRELTLRGRLLFVFALLGLMAVGFTSYILVKQRQLSQHWTDREIQQQGLLEKAVRSKEALSDLQHAFDLREFAATRLTFVRGSLRDLIASEPTEEGARLLALAQSRVEEYANALSAAESPVHRAMDRVRGQYEEASAAIATYVSFKGNAIYQSAYENRRVQDGQIQVAFILLAVFLLAGLACAFLMIAIVTRPLTSLSGMLDNVSVEGGVSTELPRLHDEAPEVRRVARSFEQLLYRLRGYQALNVRRLLVEKRRADIIAASISDGIFLLRGEEILYVNPVGERILGLPAGVPWKGLNLAQQLPATDSTQEAAKSKGILAVFNAAVRTMPVEFELVTDQRKSSYLLQSFPISEEIIERVEHSFEAPIEQLLDRWLANTLVVARDITLVKESQEAKSHFIATLSHEVKTPVTSLTMATRLLKKSVEQIPNPTHRALVETCAEDVDRLRVLIDDLLSVSRFDTLTQRIVSKRVDLPKLLRQSVQHFQPQAFERGVEIVTHWAQRRPVMVPMDASKISWAISNLMINALRHTPRGGKVEVFIDAPENSPTIEVRIRDHGPGIERGRQDRIFDKFNPFYDIRVARTGTLGMGLAIAREIIVAHGGRIWVVSEPGHGAEFCFNLPLTENLAGAEARPEIPTGLATRSDNDYPAKGDNSGASARGR